MEFHVYTDGGSRGNPGVSGFGVVVKDNSGKLLFQHGQLIGIATNNQAEYQGLIYALNWVASQPTTPTALHLYSDSELMVRQLSGHYKVKSPLLSPLFAQAKAVVSNFSFPIHYHHVLRHLNYQADALANTAMDSYVKK